MTTFHIRISISPIPAGFEFDARGFIDSTDSLLKRNCAGGCVGVATDGQIAVEMRAGSKEEASALIESYCDRFRKEQRQVKTVLIENPTAPFSESELAAATQLSAAPKTLTKSLFLKQADGVFLASNVMGPGFEPVFAEKIGSAENRAAQWARIRAVGADQRACYVFPSEAHYQRWHQQAAEFFRSRTK